MTDLTEKQLAEMSRYHSVQVRISHQVQQMAQAMAHRNGVTMKAWIEEAIRTRAQVDEDSESSD